MRAVVKARVTCAAVAMAVSAIVASPALAQSTAWGTNGYISFNGLYDAGRHQYDLQTEQRINVETARITTTAVVGRRPVFDLAVGGRVKGRLGVGFGFALAQGATDAHVSGEIPHPFFFNQPRRLDGVSSLERDDLAIHTHAMWLLPITRRFQMAVFTGPTWFRVDQEAVASVTVQDSYPFDTVSLASVTTERHKASRWGYNAGADASYFFSRNLGVQGIARYVRGQVRIGGGTSGAGVDGAPIEVGGVQIGAGLRIRY